MERPLLEPFDILDRSCPFRGSLLLEASAGTGKTFAIEHLFLRHLLSGFTVEQLLVVTFTRAAALELKLRIRSALREALSFFRGPRPSPAADYLQAIAEEGGGREAKRILENALFCFDEAQIFTIHGFCEKKLRENGHLLKGRGFEAPVAEEELRRGVCDVFRMELSGGEFCLEQLESVLGRFRYDVSLFQSELINLASSALPLAPLPGFSELFREFREEMFELKGRREIDSKGLMELFAELAPHYRGACNRRGALKEELISQVSKFASLFDREELQEGDFRLLLREGLAFAEVLHPDRLKKKAACSSPLVDEIRERLQPIVQRARDPLFTFCRIARICQKEVENLLAEEDCYRYDDLLLWMKRLASEEAFREQISKQYRAVIVDEFQDTDSHQWSLFEALFEGVHLCLVGDPKQSIYAFRGADIYVYLQASKRFDGASLATLSTNWRSHKPLVEALNGLFSSAGRSGFLSLPKLGASYPYRPVKPSPRIEERVFGDQREALHFCLVEEKREQARRWPTEEIEEAYFFPFIAGEMISLKQREGVDWGQWAVLVKDRYQARRFASYCSLCGIPFLLQRKKGLRESPALEALKEFFEAVLQRFDLKQLKKALGGPIFGWDHSAIRSLEESPRLQSICLLFEEWHRLLYERGAAACLESLFEARMDEGSRTLSEEIVSREGGAEFYAELEELSHLFMEFQAEEGRDPDRLLDYLEGLCKGEAASEEQSFSERRGGEGVRILTVHMSKGLEFDYVFALGLASRSPMKAVPVPVEVEGERRLMPPLGPLDPIARAHAEEVDAEKMRQLYVAMTRAKWRLYVPIAFQADLKEPLPLGETAPVEKLFEEVGAGLTLEGFLGWHASSGLFSSSFSLLERMPAPTKAPGKPFLSEGVAPPPDIEVKKGEGQLLSFSSLRGRSHRSFREEGAPRDFQCEEKSPQTLPAGAETGILLHEILKEVPLLKGAERQEIDKVALLHVEGTRYSGWHEVISSMVYRALNAPLRARGSSFRLSELGPDSFYREVEFLYKGSRGYVNGVIDFVCLHEGAYYLIDWKSNWLPGYGQADLERSMREHDYYLQASLYREALKKYVRLVDSRPFEECFGGTFYLFLRGLEGEGGSLFIGPEEQL